MEIEHKYRSRDPSVRERLHTAGFRHTGDTEQRDTYYIVEGRDADGNRTYLRVREDVLRGSASVDYHVGLSDAATRETEVVVGDAAAARAIFEALGFTVRCVVHKRRATFARDDVLVMLDVVDGLGAFVEIEIDGELADEHRVQAVADELHLSSADRVTGVGYPSLLLATKR